VGDQTAIRVVRTIEEVEDLRAVWISWQWNADADIDFYLAKLRSRKECLRPHIIVLYSGGRPTLMLVGRLDNGKVELKFGYWPLRSPRARVLAFIYGGVLGDQSPENCAILMQAILSCLRQGEADFALLNKVNVDSPLYSLAFRSPGFFCRDPFREKLLHCGLKLPSNTEDVYRGLSADHRAQIRRKARKLVAAYPGGIRVGRFEQPADLEPMIGDVERIAKKTYQRGLGVGFVDSPDMRRSLAMTAEKGWLRAYVLYLADNPSAFWLGTLFKGTFRSDYLGYDPAHEDFSPGTFLLTRALEDLCVAGVREVDFGYGIERYKQQFGKSTWHEGIVHIFAPTCKGVSLNVLRTFVVGTDYFFRKALERTNLLPRLKKAWRVHVRKG